jgi:hypothetical protein
MRKLFAFGKEEDGAVTVDWVVLTAGVIGISLAVLSSITSGTKTLTETVSSTVGSQTIMQTF